MTVAGDGFKVKRIVFLSADHDHLFASSRHDKTVRAQKSQVSRAQPKTQIRFMRQLGLEGRPGLFASVPISCCNAFALEPDFAHLSSRQPAARFRIDNLHPLISADLAATREAPAPRVVLAVSFVGR